VRSAGAGSGGASSRRASTPSATRSRPASSPPDAEANWTERVRQQPATSCRTLGGGARFRRTHAARWSHERRRGCTDATTSRRAPEPRDALDGRAGHARRRHPRWIARARRARAAAGARRCTDDRAPSPASPARVAHDHAAIGATCPSRPAPSTSPPDAAAPLDRSLTSPRPADRGARRQPKTTVLFAYTRTRCSRCARTARASTIFSRSRPVRTRSATRSRWLTWPTSWLMIGPSSSSAVT